MEAALCDCGIPRVTACIYTGSPFPLVWEAGSALLLLPWDAGSWWDGGRGSVPMLCSPRVDFLIGRGLNMAQLDAGAVG